VYSNPTNQGRRPPNAAEVSWWRTTPVAMYEPYEFWPASVLGCEAPRLQGSGPTIDHRGAPIKLQSTAAWIQAGFPFRSIRGEWFGIPDPSQFNWIRQTKGAIRFDRATVRRYFPGLGGWLPWHPIWPGFAINSIFYAAILWMLFALPFVVHRRRRIKRGLCPACAYPVGTSEVCTECGKPVPARSVEGANERHVRSDAPSPLTPLPEGEGDDRT
jgi:hypothetical protein